MFESKKKKAGKGLGKGLGALMQTDALKNTTASAHTAGPSAAPTNDTAPDAGERLLMIAPEDIQPNPKQPRRVFDEDALNELAESIRKDGIQEPLIVRKVNDKFQIVCGERRCRAAIIAGLREVPALCRNIADEDMLKFGLIENIQREDLNAIELALAYKELMDQYDWTQEELAEEVGKKRATVANTLRLLQLPDVIQEQVADGSLTMGHARAVAAVTGTERQLALSRKIIERGLSVRQAEHLASKETDKRPRKKSGETSKAPYLVELEEKLRRRLGAKVAVKHQEDNRGRIEIEYYSLDELDRILEIITTR